jgi:hypothetical protein
MNLEVTMKLQPHQIEKAHQALERIRTIDTSLEWFVKHSETKPSEYGEKVRNMLGSNLMRDFTNQQLGEVVLCAVMNGLLKKREEIVAGHKDLMDFPDPPCSEQNAKVSDGP